MTGLAAVHEQDTRKNEDDRHYFQDVERVHAPDDGGCGGYYRLDIVVHGHQSRPQELLSYRHYEIAEESSEYKHVGQLGILCQPVRARLLADTGIMMTDANVNIHFISVTAEYLLIKSLKITR